jgi:DNA (cytosine-5)-methyltransferase 1
MIDLFCGCGGVSLGYIRAGYDVRLGFDMDQAALMTYTNNLAIPSVKWYGKPVKQRLKAGRFPVIREDMYTRFPEATEKQRKQLSKVNHPRTVRAVICDDIRKFHGLDILKLAELDCLDVLCACAPCTGFSRMGKQKKDDPRNFLVFEAARIILEIHPSIFMMENVPELMKMKLLNGLGVYDTFCTIVNNEDWDLYYSLQDEFVKDYPDAINISELECYQRSCLL